MANTSRGGETHGAWARRKTLGGPAGAASPGTQAEAQTRRKAENILAGHLPCRLRSLGSPLAIPDDFPVAQRACKSNTQLAGRLIPPQTGHLPERGERSEELMKVHIRSANEAISTHTHCLGEGRGLTQETLGLQEAGCTDMAPGRVLVPALSLTSRGTLGCQYCLRVTASCKKIRVNHRALRSLRLPWCRAKSACSPQSGLDRWGGFLRLPHPCTEQALLPALGPESPAQSPSPGSALSVQQDSLTTSRQKGGARPEPQSSCGRTPGEDAVEMSRSGQAAGKAEWHLRGIQEGGCGAEPEDGDRQGPAEGQAAPGDRLRTGPGCQGSS